MKDGVVGIDLGGTCTKFGLVTREGKLLVSRSIPTDSTIAYDVFFEQLYSRIKNLRKVLDEKINLKGIGVGAPTGNHFLGTIDNASNLNWSGKVPVTKLLQSCSKLPTVLANDANAAAVGEMLYGAAKGYKNFIAITLGTGLGCGMVVNGNLVVGHNSHAGETGQTTVVYDGRPCKCGRRGCLETYASAPGLICTVEELIETTNIESKLRDITPSVLTAETITAAARENDLLARKALGYTGKILGLKLADIVACIDPEAIIVSGGLAKAGSLILDPAKKNLEEQLLGIFKNEVDIFPSSLTEKNAAILGAAALAWNELENNSMYNKA
jgi:glucokinase